MLRKLAPVPWVAVEIAPASVCLSMSPWFSIASPWPCSASARRSIVIPASTLTRPLARSTSSNRSSPSSLSIAPPVHAMSVNECPDAEARTVSPARAARPTASTSSARLAGCSIVAGAHA